MNAGLFAADQISMFAVGAFFGRLLGLAREQDNGSFFWWGATCFALLQACCLLVVFRMVLMPLYAIKKRDAEEAEKRKRALASRALPDFLKGEGTPSDEDYMEWGKAVLGMLHKRGWLWKKKGAYVRSMMDRFIVDLPTDTYQHRMEVLWEMDETIKRFRQKKLEIDDVFAEMNLIVGEQTFGHLDHVTGEMGFHSESSKATDL
jgi:hypothetical protein